jgi:hypothetical protein
VAAHGALTSCAAIVAGIDVLQVTWADLGSADRAELLESMHNSAVSIVDLLKGLVQGTA